MNRAHDRSPSSFLPVVGILLMTWAGVARPLRADSLAEAWKIAPGGERSYVSSGNTERGVAVNPANGNVLLLSRAGGTAVYVLDGPSGDDGSVAGSPRTLMSSDANGEAIVVGGTLALNLVGAADDGAVFAANLSVNVTTSPLRIYRWGSDQTDAPVELAYSGNPLEGIANPGTANDLRFGDTLAVRGSGAKTEILLSARSGRYLLLFQTQDGKSFTPKVLTTDVTGKIGLGLAFGDGNTAWAKLNGQPLTLLQLDIAASKATTTRPISTTIIPSNVTGIGYDPVSKRLAAVHYTAHTLSVFDLSDPANPIAIGSPLPFPTSNANGNGTGAAGLRGDLVVGLDTNNGLLAAKVEKSVVAAPPVIAVQPSGATVYASANHTLAVSVQGTPPFSYQWRFNGVNLPGKTSSQLLLGNLTLDQEGAYSVVVTNSAGSVTRRDATLSIKSPVSSTRLSPLWSLAPGSRPYVNEDNSQRGLAINPANGNVLLVSRSGSNQVVVLDGETGAEKHRLLTVLGDETPISGGTFPVNMVGVSDDGAVFVGNLTTDGSTTPFRLYRWDHDAADTVPVLLPELTELAVAERWGDAMAVRGSGNNTLVALTSRNGTSFALIQVSDGGATLQAKVFPLPELAAGDFGLGLAFGKGSTLWATASGKPLIQIGFDFEAGTASVLQSLPGSLATTSLGPLGGSPDGSMVAGIAFENPDNLQLFDVTSPDVPTLLDQELFLLDRPNINGTGAIGISKDRVVALNSNNGIQAYRLQDAPAAGPATLSIRLVAPTEAVLTLQGTPGASYRILATPGIGTAFNPVTTVTVPQSGKAEATLPVQSESTFYTTAPAL